MTTVRDYMTRDVLVVPPELDIHKAIRLLLDRRVSGVPVVDAAGNLAGLLTEKDCFRIAFGAGYHQDRGGSVADYMTQKVETVDADADIIAVAGRFRDRPYRRFPVLEAGRVVGIISRRDMLRAISDLG